MGTCGLLPRPIGTHEALSTQVTIRFPLGPICTQDTHDRTLRATRICKVPDTASAAVAAAAVLETTKRILANTVALRMWISQRQVMTTVPTTLPIGPKGQTAWITTCVLELTTIVSGLPYPIAFFASMQGKTLCAFGHFINSETQLSVIRQHTPHADRLLRELCTSWAETADGFSE